MTPSTNRDASPSERREEAGPGKKRPSGGRREENLSARLTKKWSRTHRLPHDDTRFSLRNLIQLRWLHMAARLKKKAPHTALLLLYRASEDKSKTVTIPEDWHRSFNMTLQQQEDGLQELKLAGLIHIKGEHGERRITLITELRP